MRTITNCRSCGSGDLTEIVNFGEQYLSDFREDDSKPPRYPLELVYCGGCHLVQLRHTVPSGEMYHDRYGFKSGVSESIRADLKEVVEQALEQVPEPDGWLDIASNDGTLLSFVPNYVYRVGVDPVKFLCEEAEPHANLIVNDFFQADDVLTYDDYNGHINKFDVVTSISMFYDLDDPNKFVADVARVLEDRGVWVIQQNYLLTTLELNAIDNVCHEHLEYYSLLALEPLLARHGLAVFKCSTSMVNGGSIRTFVGKIGDHAEEQSVQEQRDLEWNAGLDGIDAYRAFGAGVAVSIKALRGFVNTVSASGSSVYIYAASTRGATIWQAAGFGPEQITAAVERNPAKVGKMFSAIDVPIISERQAREEQPDYILIGPWFFADQILEREADLLAAGTQAIIPLPELRVVNG